MAGTERRTLTIVAGLVALLLLVLILVRVGGGSSHPNPPEDYLTEKSRQLGFDPNRILAFVRDGVAADDSYRGALRGPVGTLWTRSGGTRMYSMTCSRVVSETAMMAFARAA